MTEEEIRALPWASAGVRFASLVRIDERPASSIARIEIDADGGRREVIAKQIRLPSSDGRSTPQLARHEYATLSMLQRVMTEDGLTVPRPLFLDEATSTVVMERAQGSALDVVIGAARRRAAPFRARDALRAAGRWLRAMQGVTARTEEAAPLLRRQIAGALVDLGAVAARDAKVRRSRDLIERRLQRLEEPVLAAAPLLVGRHVDYWPGNIFVSAGVVEVIDLEGFREGLPMHDVAYFLSHLRTLPLAFIDGDLLCNAFLDGYLSGRPLDSEGLALFSAVCALRGLARPEGPAAPARGRRFRQMRRVVLRLTTLR